MIIKLAFIFIILTLIVGTEKIAQSLITIALNLLLFFGILVAILYGLNPVIATMAGCIFIFINSIFYQNQVNPKTMCSFYSVLIVMLLTVVFTYWICSRANLQGFPIGQFYTIKASNGYSDDIKTNMLSLQVAVTLVVMLGSAIDTSLSVSSSLYEVSRHNTTLSQPELFQSGLSIGKDILSSTINTLFFIFIAEYLTMFIYLIEYSDIAEAINSKEVAQQVIIITIAGIASVLVIPITSYICSRKYRGLAK